MKKRVMAFASCLIIILFALCGCGASEQAQAVIDQINAIGDVNYDDESLIGACEDAYLKLTEEQQKEVSNLDKLSKAREKMDELIAVRPIPFSNANWETTKDELIEMYGNPDDEGDNQFYGHMLRYNNIENEGYTGTAKYGFENGKLTRVFFYIDGYDKDIIEYFQNLFTTKYGEPTYHDEYGTKRWDTKNVSCVLEGGTSWGGYVNVIYMSPKLVEG